MGTSSAPSTATRPALFRGRAKEFAQSVALDAVAVFKER